MHQALKQNLSGQADIGASHLALLKLLERKELLTKEDLEFYYKERMVAKKYLIAVTMSFFLASGVMNLNEDDADEAAVEMGYKNRFDMRDIALEALDYLYAPAGELEEMKKILGA